MGISVCCENLKHSIVDSQKCNIESSTTKIEYKHIGLSSSLVHTVCNSSRCRLVDNTLNLHTRNSTCILCGLTLGIIEVGRHCHYSILDILAEEGLSNCLHLLKNHSRNLLRSKLHFLTLLCYLHNGLVAVCDNGIRHKLLISLNGFVSVVSADETLHIKDGIFGVDGGLVLGGISDETVTILHESHVGWCNTVTLVIGHNLHTSILEDTDAGVGCSKVNSDNCSH
mmetsp:Transcript_368/g.438  ORF Transcript_368/g.438 Transcript_368/m.438 type:complete len:226 (+) Transcript_368:1348-2025(+)